jgi:DNA-binding response OmpR family regulator
MMQNRIVHIDDDETLRDLLTLGAKKEGWLLFSYPYARRDLVPLEQINPDLIILDFGPLLGGVGWEFLQRLKMNDETAHIPIIVLTTPFSLSAEIQDYLLTGYINVVHKPFDVETLVEMVSKTLMEARQRTMLLSGDRTLPILLVDNDDDLRDTFATVLRLENYRVVTANNGKVALDTVSEANFCLILLDIDMPVMNGYQFLDAYAQQLRPHSPVIIVSGNLDIASHTLPRFVVDSLTKPFNINRLLKVVSKYSEPVST